MADQGGSAPGFHKPRIVNRVFYRVMTLLLRRFIFRYFMLEPVNGKSVPKKGAGIILANHNNLFDVIWLYAMLRRPVYYMANEDLFRKRGLRRLIRWFGAFPKKKAASDPAAMRSMMTIIRKGGLIGIFPEGVRSWDGSNQRLTPPIAHLIRRLGLPVYTCRFEGAYLAYPRWARRWRRIPVRGVFSRLYSPESIPGDEERILADISAAIRTPDVDMRFPGARRRRAGLAVNITRVLYRCPSCSTMEGLKLVRPFSTNRVECSSCFSTWEVNAESRLCLTDENGRTEGSWIPLREHLARIRAMPLAPIRTEIRLGLEPSEQLFLVSRPRFLLREAPSHRFRLFAFGRAFLTDRRLIFRNRLGVRLSAPLSAVAALSVDPGDRLHFSFEKMFYRIPFRNESVVKWYDLIRRFPSGASEGKGLPTEHPAGKAAS